MVERRNEEGKFRYINDKSLGGGKREENNGRRQARQKRLSILRDHFSYR